MNVEPFRFRNSRLELFDQRKLPAREVWVRCRNSSQVYRAICNMTVRGAPAIGVVGVYGLYLGVARFKGAQGAFLRKLKQEAEYLKSSRPTGVNLRNVIDHIVAAVETSTQQKVEKLKALVLQEAIR